MRWKPSHIRAHARRYDIDFSNDSFEWSARVWSIFPVTTFHSVCVTSTSFTYPLRCTSTCLLCLCQKWLVLYSISHETIFTFCATLYLSLLPLLGFIECIRFILHILMAKWIRTVVCQLTLIFEQLALSFLMEQWRMCDHFSFDSINKTLCQQIRSSWLLQFEDFKVCA